MSRQRTGNVGCRAEARRVQSMVKMKPAGSPRAANRHPAEARCRAEASSSAVDGEDEASRLLTRSHLTPSRGQVPGGGPQSAVDGEDEAGRLPTRSQ